MVALLIGLSVYFSLRKPSETIDEKKYFDPSALRTQPAETAAAGASEDPDVHETPVSEPEPYISPVDFEALWEVNEDIYAWLYIPGTEISYPLLQHSEDDAYYLRRNMEGKQDSNGSLFTESNYNGKDFTDPLTIIYGHNMHSGKMFGTVQKVYSSQSSLAEHSEIIIYLPDKELHYDVFAAVPFDNRHILHNYDFTNRRTFRLFFNEILSVRTLEAVFAEDTDVRPDDKTVILSTCLLGSNHNKRFLICGKLSQTIPMEISNK